MIRILWTQKLDVAPMPPRQRATMAYDSARGRTVLFGGLSTVGGVRFFNDTWEWDGTNWTQMADSGPAARCESAMAFDAERKQTVLFSGNIKTPDTWGWDGLNWTQLADSGPPARDQSAMAYDAQRKQILIFSGIASPDTWGWNGTDWTQLAETGPAGRYLHAMAYDSQRDRTVLFGGQSFATGAYLGDTWEWDGATWTQVSEFGPPACVGAALAFKGDSVALFGGASVTQDLGITWTWDGKHWTLRQDFGPQPRIFPCMVYDTKRGCLVLFAGSAQIETIIFNDTWEHSEG